MLLFGGGVAAHDVAASGGMGCHDLCGVSEQRSEGGCVELLREVEKRRVASRQRLDAEDLESVPKRVRADVLAWLRRGEPLRVRVE